MAASEIISAFGGTTRVAALTGASRSSVCNWRHDGIPAKFWLTLLDAAERDGVPAVTRDAVSWRPERGAGEKVTPGAPAQATA